MHVRALTDDLKRLSEALAAVRETMDAMRAEHDALAAYIFTARREYRNTKGSKDGRLEERRARMSFPRASELGFSCSFECWEALLRASPRRKK